MPKIVVCEQCGDAHWEDRRCPTCEPISSHGDLVDDLVREAMGFFQPDESDGAPQVYMRVAFRERVQKVLRRHRKVKAGT